ncbi:hypothetical protein ACHAXM_009088 [Skeletonema potamos]|jgi:catabolite regulation protein CreA
MKAAIAVVLLALSGANAFTTTPSALPRVATHINASPSDDQFRSADDQFRSSRRKVFSSILAGAAAVATSANAAEPRTLAQISGSGLVFKDTLIVEAFDDPKVKGVTLYVSNFERPLTERVQKDFFTEPSYASVTAVKTGPIEVADTIDKSNKGEPVFSEKKSLLFKELRVQRIYDEEKKTLVYVSYNTRLDKGSDTNKSRFKSSVSAIAIEPDGPALPPPQPVKSE